MKDSTRTPKVAVAHGDGIGPEIMAGVLHILEAAGARLDLQTIEVGESVYKSGHSSGIAEDTWDQLLACEALLKAPITTPQGSGYKSLNVTLRKTLALFANVRPCRSFNPIIQGPRTDIDCVIVRENEEDTYAGIEHRQTPEVTQCLKLISRPGCERVIRYAFEYAKRQDRRRVTCMVKDNIMKITDGLFHEVFREIAAEYPDLNHDVKIIDIGTALLAERPESFDVIVTLNLYGDIISDVVAQLCGSVGMFGSANIGRDFAMFEAVHGSAPDIAGQDLANPSGLLQAAVMMLLHLGQGETAATLQNAWLKTLEDGYRTGDVFRGHPEEMCVGTRAFTREVIDRLGQEPRRLLPARFGDASPITIKERETPRAKKDLYGVDVFLDWTGEARDPAQLGQALEQTVEAPLKLKMITNRGVKVYPGGFPGTFCTDHWRCRFTSVSDDHFIQIPDVLGQLQRMAQAGFDIIKTEHLYFFDGHIGYSLGQGE